MNSPQTAPGQIAPTSYPLQFNGKTYLVGPLSTRDFRELEKQLRNQVFSEIKDIIKDLPPIAQKAIIEKAWEDHRAISIGSDEFNRRLESVDGAAQLLYLAIRGGDKTFTIDTAMEMIIQIPDQAKEALSSIQTSAPSA